MSLGTIFLSEIFGTAMLTLLGCGVVANVLLAKTKGNNGGFLMITWGWAIAVLAGVYVAARSGAHLNPAVTLGLIPEIIGTFVLVFVILTFGGTPTGLGPLAVALLVLGIGVSLGGPTGYAINPARDLGPRIAHFLLPIKGKGDSDWSYSWVPVVGPLIGGGLAGLLATSMPIVFTAATK
jgi:glycerol uptake facilitator-like aquaporin